MRRGHLLGLRWGVGPGIASLLALLLLSSPTGAAAAKKKKHGDVANIGARDINKGSWNLYSTEREMALGDWLARNFELTTRRLKDPLATDYVDEVAELVVRHSDLRMPLRVRVIVSDEIDAIALPGGHLFITTGLILDTQSEAELASVIAHQVAHLAARHVTKQLTKREMWTWMSIPLALVGGPIALTVNQGLQLAGPLAFLHFSHNAEHEADFLGLQYHYASGYDPAAFLNYFERMKQREKSGSRGIARTFSPHLMTRRRIAAAQRTIQELLPARDEYVVTTSKHDEVRAHLGELLDERDPQEATPWPKLRKGRVTEHPPETGKKNARL